MWLRSVTCLSRMVSTLQDKLVHHASPHHLQVFGCIKISWMATISFSLKIGCQSR